MSDDKNQFKIRIDNVGTDTFSVGYKTIKDKDALILARDVCKIMTEAFVHKEHAFKFLSHLGNLLLNESLIENFNEKHTIDAIKNAQQHLNRWKLTEG